MPDTDYVWYLGDSVRVIPKGFEEILSNLGDNFDFCFVNSYTKDTKNRVILPKDIRHFLVEKTWYLTLSGATIFGRKARQFQISEERSKNWRNFPQLGLILEYCSNFPAHCYWSGLSLLSFNKKKESYWLKSTFSVFVQDWVALIRSFPMLFSSAEMNQIIRSLGLNTRLFNLKFLLYLRSIGGLSFDILNEHKFDFKNVSPINPIWARLVCFIPQVILLKILVFYRNLKGFIKSCS